VRPPARSTRSDRRAGAASAQGRALRARREVALHDAHRRGHRARAEAGQPGALGRGHRATTATSANLYDPANLQTLQILQQCLRANTLYSRDTHYMVKDGEVLIIDEHTGRTLPGRRWSEGLHQAVEAKERVEIQDENRTLATISFQNLFRLYNKLSGMTGTADTEAASSTDLQAGRGGHPHQQAHRAQGRTRTSSTRPSARSSRPWWRRSRTRTAGPARARGHHQRREVGRGVEPAARNNIPHNVLNAKQHEREAYVVAQAGVPGAVTVATNMAGRGTDIVLGGNPEMLAEMDVMQNLAPEQREDREAVQLAARRGQEALRGHLQGQPEARARRGWPAHGGHRAPRVAPHRQPAARTLGPSG
jgi:hypothetical protein